MGEESLAEIKIRAQRVGGFNDKLFLLCETNLEIIENVLKETMPQIVIIDSIQTMYGEKLGSAPGSVGQVRERTRQFSMQLAKGLNISIFIVGHVTKEGVVAARVLEHMVDTVLYFEGDRNAAYKC